MKNILSIVVIFMTSLALSGVALGQEQAPNVGMVNVMSGNVQYSNGGSAPTSVKPYMMVRQGDKITLAPGSALQIIYFSAGVKESWTGQSTFVATNAGGEYLRGSKPGVVKLPAAIPDKLSRVSGLIAGSRVGGVAIRAVGAVPDPSKREKEVAEAMSNYESMKVSSGVSDVTPELYLFSVLQEYEMYDDLKAVAMEMLRLQPQNPEVSSLAKWAIKKAEDH